MSHMLRFYFAMFLELNENPQFWTDTTSVGKGGKTK